MSGTLSFMRWLAAAYAIVLAYLLLSPEPLSFLGQTGSAIDASVSASVADWVEHGVAYCILAGLFLATARGDRILWSVGMAALHGVAAEVLQNWVPHREPSWIDAFANVTGISIAAAAYVVWRCWFSRRVMVLSAAPKSPSPGECLGAVGSRSGTSS